MPAELSNQTRAGRAVPKSVVVTGASAGAGRAIAELFARQGYRVALLARDEERLRRLHEDLEAQGATVLGLPTDVADHAAVLAARDRVLERWGAIDVWVNCAMATVLSPVSEMTAEEYRRVTEVTYLGCVHGTLAALEHMRSRDAGHIVQVGSALAYRAIPLQSAYCAAKFAMRGFTDALRTELIYTRSRVQVTMVQMPGMNTPQFDWARNKFPYKYQPVGTVYQPEVAARAVWRAVRERPRELWVGWSAIKSIIGQLFAPALLDRLAAREAWAPQLTNIPEALGRPDNLDRTVRGPFGAHGRFDARARRSAFVLNPQRAWMPLLAAAAAFTALWWQRDDRSRRVPGARRKLDSA